VESRLLIACAERAFTKAMVVARAGFRVFEIGRVVEREVRRCGFSVIRDLGGHGIGRTIHEEPRVPNYADPEASQILTEGLVITVEPIIAAGSGRALSRTMVGRYAADRRPSAHFEHTLVITQASHSADRELTTEVWRGRPRPRGGAAAKALEPIVTIQSVYFVPHRCYLRSRPAVSSPPRAR
jgi:methionine aminopeptidase